MASMPLPAPKDLTSTVLRTDFSNDADWAAVQAAIDAADGSPHATYVSDPRFTDMSIQALIDEEAATEEDDKLTYVFLADATTMSDPSSLLLAVDLYDEPGRTFRVPALWYPEISANLSIANMDFADFADAADGSGTFRGWGED
ncbi:DUF6924 domain-containing protein [Streptomyces sp. NPDC059176]|uniref:DUF6924 domain-containing protein n=1 Tax=unclassified Streptomyces TaxID=2593676 RepID=UPI0036A2B264